VDADQLSPGRQLRSESKPALLNKNGRVEFKTCNRVLSLETMSEELVEQVQTEDKGASEIQSRDLSPRESPFESFTERRRVLYKDFYQHRDFEKKMRDDEIRYNHRDYKEKEKERVIVRRIIKTNLAPAPWVDFVDHPSPFVYFQSLRTQKEDNIWELKTKVAEELQTSYCNPSSADSTQTLLAEGREAESDEWFERKRCKEEEVRVQGLQRLLQKRTYS
jgi:hypothetical protein